jgi:hypothetical protein
VKEQAAGLKQRTDPNARANGANIRLPGSGTSTHILSSGEARRRGMAEAKEVAGDAWKTMSAEERMAAIKSASAQYEGPAQTNGVDRLMKSRALPFDEGKAQRPVSAELGDTAKPQVEPIDDAKAEAAAQREAGQSVPFSEWKKKYAPNDSGEDYDLRAAHKAGIVPDAQGHMPDTFKKPNHPTFSVESQFVMDAPTKAGYWKGDKFVQPAAVNLRERATALKESLLGRGVSDADARKTIAAFLEANQK